MTITRKTALWATRGVLAGGTAVLLAACGSSANSNAPGDQGGYGGPGGGPSSVGNGQGGFGPGASGQVEAISGRTAQVQNTQLNQQVAVTWTSSTKFTQEVSASKSSVTVGSCVVVRAPQTSSTAGATAAARPTEITAASVRISAPVGGTCTQGAGRPGGQGQPGGASTGGPSGFGSRGGQAGPNGGRGFRSFGAFGTVTSVSAAGFTVQSTFGGQSSTTTVTTTGSTTYLTTAQATAAAVKVGACLQAAGTADSTGAVTATRVSVTQPVGGNCTGGFGPRG